MNWSLWWVVSAIVSFALWFYYDGYWDDYEEAVAHFLIALIPGLNLLMVLGVCLLIWAHWRQFGRRGLGFFK